jgi:replicative DNA helicase
MKSIFSDYFRALVKEPVMNRRESMKLSSATTVKQTAGEGSPWCALNQERITMERTLPHNVEAESALLGSLILDPSKMDDVKSLLCVKSFYERRNAQVWEVILGMQTVDLVLLVSSLREAGWYDEIGGATRLDELMRSVAVSAHAVYYAERIAKAHYRRRVINSLTMMIDDYYDETMPEDKLKSKTASLLRKILSTVTEEDKP